MSIDHQLFVVGPTVLVALNSAMGRTPELPWDTDGALEVWSEAERVFAFSDDPEIAAHVAVAIAEVLEASPAASLTADAQGCSLFAGSVGNVTSEDGRSLSSGSITHYRMGGDGESATVDTLSLTYEEEVPQLDELLDLEMMALLEIGENLSRLGQKDDDSSP